MPEFVTKDSGQREHFDSGMQRDTEVGKPRFDLMLPEGVAYEDQLITRFAALLSRGAEKYEDRNWEKANSHDEVARAKSSAFRHFMQWMCGERDEDHSVAVIFNMMVVETVTPRLAEPEDADHDFAAIADEIFKDRQGPVPTIPPDEWIGHEDSDGGGTFIHITPREQPFAEDVPDDPSPPAAGGMAMQIFINDPGVDKRTVADMIHESMNRRDVRRENLRFD